MNPVDLSQRRRIHVIGVAGPGMSALATVLAEMGHHVTGSDLRDLPVLDRVRRAGAKVLIGHDATAVDGADYVVYVGAIYGYFQEAKRSYLGAAADNIGNNQAESIAKAVLGELV